VSFKNAVRIGFVAAALSGVALVVVAGPASASQVGTASVPASHHHKGTDQLDEDGPSYNEPEEPKDADQERSDITPAGVPVHGSADSVQDAPDKVLPGNDEVIAPSSQSSLLDGGGLGN
jgi:hypothetical protein